MGAVQRITEYLEKKGISKYKFYKTTKLSNGLLDKGENLSSYSCEIIFNHYKDLNIEWLIAGQGQMLKKTYPELESSQQLNEPESDVDEPTYNATPNQLLMDLQRKLNEATEEHLKDLKDRDRQIAKLQDRLWELQQLVNDKMNKKEEDTKKSVQSN